MSGSARTTGSGPTRHATRRPSVSGFNLSITSRTSAPVSVSTMVRLARPMREKFSSASTSRPAVWADWTMVATKRRLFSSSRLPSRSISSSA
jgi:hypothetical protein